MALRISIFSTISFGLLFLLYAQPPVPQDIAYHFFIDKRSFFGIHNFFDVTSSLAFLVAGLIGFRHVFKSQNFIHPSEKVLWGFFFCSVMLVSVGSVVYHWAPTNKTLVWDRIPMTMAFMSLFGAVLAEKIHPRLGITAGPMLIILGILSIHYWRVTEMAGAGDLRPYFAVQFISLGLMPLILMMFEGKYKGQRYLLTGLFCYVIAKICELNDQEIFIRLHHNLSGHTLKHLFSALGVYMGYVYLVRRRIKADL